MRKKHYTNLEILENCLKNITHTGAWTPLPCREIELAYVNNFFDLCFLSPINQVLVIYGAKGTGKTGLVWNCTLMSKNFSDIYYKNMNDEAQDDEMLSRRGKKLVILDNFDPKIGNHMEKLNYLLLFNISVVIATREFSTDLMPTVASNYQSFYIIRLSRYTGQQIIEILLEKMAEAKSAVTFETLSKISFAIHLNNQTIPDAVQYLVSTIKNRIEIEKRTISY